MTNLSAVQACLPSLDFAYGMLAQVDLPPTYRFLPFLDLGEWWRILLLLAGSVLLVAWVVYLYVRDSEELPAGTSVALLSLRILAFAGLLMFFLNLERRIEQKLVKNSRALLVLDTSLSMGLRDDESSGATGPSRMQKVVFELAQGALVSELRQKHDVVAYRFDEASQPVEIATLPKVAVAEEADAAWQRVMTEQKDRARFFALLGGVGLAMAILALGGAILLRYTAGGGVASWALAVGAPMTILALACFMVAHLMTPEFPILDRLGLRGPLESLGVLESPARESDDPAANEGETETEGEATSDAEALAALDWEKELYPRGAKTRIGDALRYLVSRERGGPIAGIVLVTDGGQNTGIDPELSLAAAKNAKIPIFAVGMGSTKRPINVRVDDLEIPERVYPGDDFAARAVIRGFGVDGRSLAVRLYSRPAESGEQADTLVDEQNVSVAPEGQETAVRFELDPPEPGKYVYSVRVEAPEQDVDSKDDFRAANVEVVERSAYVLLLAGGPMREYQFLRNLLFRDEDMQVDVLLQSGQPGMSQESDQLLFEFPKTEEELFEYDCIVAFDPDWDRLTPEQLQMLEKWVAEEAGGLIVVAGPVYTPQWTRRGRGDSMDVIKDLYPVSFFERGAATIRIGRFGGEKPFPLEFSREGREAQFLWMADSSVENEATWTSFEGVYGYYAVKDPKRGAQVYARFSDPETEIEGELPIYLASQFYGAGRVFFQASGEMWRMRAEGEEYFDRYYTKLIRWVSQGRLLRDSKRGLLLVDKERALLGDTIVVTGILADEQRRPLPDAEVQATLRLPDGSSMPLTLRKTQGAAREGMFTGQFAATLDGDYLIAVQPPGALADEVLMQDVKVRVPDLEIERPLRNDALLGELAESSGGAYYVGLDAAKAPAGRANAKSESTDAQPASVLAAALLPQDQETFLQGLPDRDFQQTYAGWLLFLICTALCFEWTIRRLHRLA